MGERGYSVPLGRVDGMGMTRYSYTPPKFPSDLQLKAPVWFWAFYILVVVFIGSLGWSGGPGAVLCSLFVAAFSAQFYTYAAWNGVYNDYLTRREEIDD